MANILKSIKNKLKIKHNKKKQREIEQHGEFVRSAMILEGMYSDDDSQADSECDASSLEIMTETLKPFS